MPPSLTSRLPSLGSIAPASLAAELRHLPGFFFLDSSSSESGELLADGGRFSLITARPRSVVKGHLFHEPDYAALRELLASRRLPESTTPDLGFPGAGLYGTIEYEGDFVFGEYDEFLLYDHRSGTWTGSGSLAAQRKSSSSGSPHDLPKITFHDELDRTLMVQNHLCFDARSALGNPAVLN